MKKLTLLVAIAALATSCNFKASGNHGVIKVEHKPATAEEMHHKVEKIEHAEQEKHVETEVKDSTKIATSESTTKIEENNMKAEH